MPHETLKGYAVMSEIMHYLRAETGMLLAEEHAKSDIWQVISVRDGFFRSYPVIAELQVSGNGLEITIREELIIRGITVKKGDAIHYNIAEDGKIIRLNRYNSSISDAIADYLSVAFPSSEILPKNIIEQDAQCSSDELSVKK